jgi:hypothetical protein
MLTGPPPKFHGTQTSSWSARKVDCAFGDKVLFVALRGQDVEPDSLAYPTVDNRPTSAAPDRKSRSAGLCLAVSLSLLIIVPVQQTSLVGGLSRGVPAIIVLLAIFTVATRKPQLVWQPTVLLCVYAIICAGSTLAAPDVGGTRQLVAHLAIGGSAFLMGLSCTTYERILVARSVIVLAVAESLYGVGEVAGILGPTWGYVGWASNGLGAHSQLQAAKSELFVGLVRAQGTLGEPLVLAFLAVVGIGLIIGLRPFPLFLQIPLVCGMFAGIFAAGSRSGLVIATLLILFSARRVSKRIAVGGWLLVLSLTIFTWFNFWESPVIDRFQNSYSYSFRALSVTAFGPLMTEQNTAQVLFGNGLWSTRRLFLTGVLPYKGKFFAIDNQFVSTLACLGLISLACIVGAMAWSWLNGDRQYRWGLLAVFIMFWSFEVLMWPSSLALTLAMMGMAVGGRREELDAVLPPSEPERYRRPAGTYLSRRL